MPPQLAINGNLSLAPWGEGAQQGQVRGYWLGF